MSLRLALPLALSLATPLAALELDQMTDAERESFRAEVRAYLLDNPEVLMEAIGILEQRESEAQAAADIALARNNADALFNDGHSWVGGNPDGDITLVEFMDYRCGYCRQAFAEVEQLLETDGNIRFIVKELPILGEQSVLAAQFAIAVQQVNGDEAYKTIHDALMTLRSDVSPDTLSRLADTFGLDPAPILARMNGPEVAAVIAENRALAQAMQISGTPTFVLEDTMLRGYVPLPQMQQIVAKVRQD
jgi:protein-disulfide isomerase